ncbi:6-O-methylguanine DNA methyltransferase [Candidatus Adlerbacteria bacterium RIFOXYC1_FULL_48_26]|uniref:6-O-methylguanine DNA methyltransferase n=1 Tax=Candidatus Adlerbacteria bacterium RIFOXYC1_FULL_48_26 TaxID=1797247 RepID=A0A1F4Y3G1_9BACT|nr:MAG: 6-O-methylguanine DNA methyltransferase [Candidatus Adlerbacteria bacterium RIFOXYC1_FULL_48_26]OGC93809.1 MAG: 6-O-methylguanine DNA methyltransferase [Candidatus Adlerbacteria bacterium RIFOXYB1_FULL_48_10]OGC95858.1 MAG: 6-O-methylguanine DNA methyltransferase [Candidatus Adlerbacteria bacterium RIFOXYD1_FULL_48_8]
MRNLKTPPSSEFAKKVRALVSKIPKGKTMTYGQVAQKAGKPGAARAVGYIMSMNYDPKVPCHRVVRADGKVGDYNRGGAARKMKLLQEEGAIKAAAQKKK